MGESYPSHGQGVSAIMGYNREMLHELKLLRKSIEKVIEILQSK